MIRKDMRVMQVQLRQDQQPLSDGSAGKNETPILELSWLGNVAAVRAFLVAHRYCKPEVLLLSETHLDSYLAECLSRKLRTKFKIVSVSDEEGWLVLFWRREVSV